MVAIVNNQGQEPGLIKSQKTGIERFWNKCVMFFALGEAFKQEKESLTFTPPHSPRNQVESEPETTKSYKIWKFFCFFWWIPAYIAIIKTSIEAQHAKYSFVMCSICFAWEIFYGVWALNNSGDWKSKVFNVVYVTLELGISFCLVAYGNTETKHWGVLGRLALLLALLAFFMCCFVITCSAGENMYDEKRHFTAWIIVTLIPFFMYIERFEFATSFVTFAAIGDLCGLGTYDRPFANKGSQSVLHVLLVTQTLATIYFVSVTYGIGIFA